ncbi:protein of unknown function [Vibrio tapetis subsp. tapetis]|uniref:Uncharacterized protein n=1 Tax=Vibrio tapetis subsp. tapetis TaxID=1671868 RepID=A0A2N8ZEB7_9VIBR|nr:protein of unknown function [Vibrio tapetis subsp. tapetis]
MNLFGKTAKGISFGVVTKNNLNKSTWFFATAKAAVRKINWRIHHGHDSKHQRISDDRAASLKQRIE